MNKDALRKQIILNSRYQKIAEVEILDKPDDNMRIDDLLTLGNLEIMIEEEVNVKRGERSVSDSENLGVFDCGSH